MVIYNRPSWGELDVDDSDYYWSPPKQVPNSSGYASAQMPKSGSIIVVCRTCEKKGEHWTSKCPFKDLVHPLETFVENPSPLALPATGATKGAYVPPTVRAGARANVICSNDENYVRVDNLSEDARACDLLELFGPFGNVSHVYVAVDPKTGINRGFGFVYFVKREDGERAIAKLNGYGFDNLILSVEWAAVHRAT